MLMTVFEYSNYKQFLKDKIYENTKKYGYKGELARAAGCQRAYLSQVLKSQVHLTPDHAAGLVLFWALVNFERDYFLELVNYSRAGTPALKKIIEERMKILKFNNDSVTGRIKKPKIENTILQAQYYSSWYYSAIHILLTISKFQTVTALAERLNLSKSIISSAISVLAKAGLVVQQGEQWTPASFDLHLPSHSPLGSSNHMNWRMQAVQDSQNPETEGIHFTAVYSLSKKDYQKIRAKILELISESREVALASQEEEVFSFCCDIFKI